MGINKFRHEVDLSGKDPSDLLLGSMYRYYLLYSGPLAPPPENAPSEDWAFWIHIEEKFALTDILTDPENFGAKIISSPFSFDSIKENINTQHLERIQDIWRLVLKNAITFAEQAKMIESHCGKAPNLPQKTKENSLNEISQYLVDAEYRNSPNENLRIANGVREEMNYYLSSFPKKYTKAAILDLQPKRPKLSREKLRERISIWKIKDRAFRECYYRTQKEFLVSLRAYYELLLEKDESKNDYVISKDATELRQDIVVANRYLRIIDIVIQLISSAKMWHNEQDKRGRFRKTKLEPYLHHELEVILSVNRLVIPHIIERKKLPAGIRLNTLMTVCALHDLLEDTDFSISLIKEKLKQITNAYDGTLFRRVKGAFGLNAEGICRKYLDLIKPRDLKDTEDALRIVSKNIPMEEEEKTRAAKQGICSKEVLLKSIGANAEETKSWSFGKKQKNTFVQFPKEHDGGKLTEFLIRLTAMKGSKNAKICALMTKIADRAQNIKELEGMTVDKQFENLRETTTRLIAWLMLDHDNDKMPVYNLLPHLIKVTIDGYERIQTQFPDKFEEMDSGYLKYLYQCQSELNTRNLAWEEPEIITDPVNKYRQTVKENALKTCDISASQ